MDEDDVAVVAFSAVISNFNVFASESYGIIRSAEESTNFFWTDTWTGITYFYIGLKYLKIIKYVTRLRRTKEILFIDII
jgi:hypothetical protein